jgi:hypothetical protein
MACPYFYPIERFDEKAWTKHPRLPLGDPYTGFCHADPMREWIPDGETLRERCNLGSARTCKRFPKEQGPDAVRFSITSDQDNVLKIFFVRERDHATVDHGVLEYQGGRFLNGSDPSELLRKQARAYAESYLRRKNEPDLAAKNPHRR